MPFITLLRSRAIFMCLLTCAFGALPRLAQSHEKPLVALVMKSLANEFFLTMETGAREHQRQHAGDYDLITNGIKDEIDTVAQIKIVDQMIVSRADVIVIAPADSKALVGVVKKAINAGILVVNIDNRFDPEVLKSRGMVVPFVGPDNRKGARLAGGFLAKTLKSGDRVAIIEGIPTTTNAQQRTLGFMDAMKAVGANVVGGQSGQWEMGKGNSVAAALLNAHPDLKALLCDNDSMALGAVSAVRAAGRTGQIQVIGFEYIKAVKPRIPGGRILATRVHDADEPA